MPVTYDIGAPVSCSDGPCGQLSRVVVDPRRQTVTHLVVEPHHHHGLGRLVPVKLVDAQRPALQLHCTLATFHALPYAEETEFLPADEPWPPSGYPNAGPLTWLYLTPVQTIVQHECVPLGDVELRRGDRVHATDGPIGRVHGLVVNPSGQHVTHVLLGQGHLWGAREVAIPIGAVTLIDADGVHVSLTRHAISELPQIELEPHPAGD